MFCFTKSGGRIEFRVIRTGWGQFFLSVVQIYTANSLFLWPRIENMNDIWPLCACVLQRIGKTSCGEVRKYFIRSQDAHSFGPFSFQILSETWKTGYQLRGDQKKPIILQSRSHVAANWGGRGVSAFQRWWSCTDHHGNHLTAVTQQPIKPFSIPRRVLTMFPESAAAVSHCSPPWICLQEVRRVRFPAFPSCYCRFVWF